MDQLHYPQRVGKDNANPIIRLTVEVGGKLKITRGRNAWTLSELISSGSLGVTPIEPAFLGDDSDAVKISAARYSGNRVAEITEISAGLKALAKEINVPLVALAQLSRATINVQHWLTCANSTLGRFLRRSLPRRPATTAKRFFWWHSGFLKMRRQERERAYARINDMLREKPE